MSDNITFETDNYRWFIKLKRKDRQTTATVTGMAPKHAQSVSTGGTVSKQAFTLTEPDQDSLLKHVRDKIKQVDGPILRTDY